MTMPTKTKLVAVSLAAAAILIAIAYLNRDEASASTQSTDDAYVQADFTVVSPQVSGIINNVLVDENQKVRAGELLATIDDRDFQVAVSAAAAEVKAAEATVAGLSERIQQQDSLIRQSKAAIASDSAEVVLAQANQRRYRNLAADGSGSIQARQQAEASLAVRMAGRERNRAGLDAALQQTEILKSDLQKSEAALAKAKAALDAANLALSYTRIRSPIDGVVGQRSVRLGAHVSVGKPLLAVVPLDEVYIAANFRETQLARVRVGQNVAITIDALPGVRLNGSVESLGPASGVSYSPVAPHNATGNFTKIVQRLPVRIRIEPGQKEAGGLRVGMSVTPRIAISE
ncbi:HlyD family secretion protein [Stenotrophomonas maltophilia]|uniref:HlyD family secretion protein n=1 Tax=Stenotrophomonas maltophilia TaxID=40324 RepID=UPI0012AFAE15|nr:HlyD family secretion protein [Stenotrophomonas maltophilia]QGM05641.1 HlyD family secretion protein [Stenotrophomonas maltophilia]